MSDQFWGWALGLVFAFMLGTVAGFCGEILHRWRIVRAAACDDESWQKYCDFQRDSALRLDRLIRSLRKR